jgi:hypothetical protein
LNRQQPLLKNGLKDPELPAFEAMKDFPLATALRLAPNATVKSSTVFQLYGNLF